MLRVGILNPTDTGASPSGKASAFDADIRWFESSRPCQIFIYRIRKAALENDPVDRFNRRGFSAEKRIQLSLPFFFHFHMTQ